MWTASGHTPHFLIAIKAKVLLLEPVLGTKTCMSACVHMGCTQCMMPPATPVHVHVCGLRPPPTTTTTTTTTTTSHMPSTSIIAALVQVQPEELQQMHHFAIRTGLGGALAAMVGQGGSSQAAADPFGIKLGMTQG
jgi:hypothetical protein